MNTEESLLNYFNGVAPFKGFGLEVVRSSYNWQLPKTSFKNEQMNFGGTNFEANIKLKLFLNKCWHEDAGTRKKIVKWIISDWGGIRGNKESTLEKYYALSLQKNPETPLNGIASFSKVLAIVDPLKYAIYDARVAVSLNAVQMICTAPSGEVFPYLPGRNNITGNWDPKDPRGFSKNSAASIKTLLSPPYNWRKIPKNDAYTRYLEILKSISDNINVPLYELEMTLFSQAETLALEAIPSLRTK